jgi:hypothetical protein
MSTTENKISTPVLVVGSIYKITSPSGSIRGTAEIVSLSTTDGSAEVLVENESLKLQRWYTAAALEDMGLVQWDELEEVVHGEV